MKEQVPDYLKMAIDSMVDDEVEGPRVILGLVALKHFFTLVRNAALEELSEKCIGGLTRADWKPSSIFRHYYPSANGDWVDLRELKKIIESLKEPTP